MNHISSQKLGIALIIALIIQFVFPVIKLGSLGWIGTALVLIVAVLLLVKS
jgi:hypothetical protein